MSNLPPEVRSLLVGRRLNSGFLLFLPKSPWWDTRDQSLPAFDTTAKTLEERHIGYEAATPAVKGWHAAYVAYVATEVVSRLVATFEKNWRSMAGLNCP